MKIELTREKTAPEGATLVQFDESKNTRFIEKADGTLTLSLGVGKRADVTQRRLIVIARKIITTAKSYKLRKIAFDWTDLHFPKVKLSGAELASLLTQAFVMANYEFTAFKKEPKEGWGRVEEVVITGAASAGLKKGVEKGRVIAEELNKARDLSNTPGGDMTPKLLARAAKDAAKGTAVKVTVLGETEMKKLKMGAVLGVGQGSSEESQFIILEYRGGKTKERPVVLCGKGVTFDTGGLHLKPEQGIGEMFMDMSGGAAVIHAVVAAARLGLKKNVVGLVPAVENMPSGASFRPMDILKSMSGKTIEVGSTDAEGRLILADALTYAKKYNPRLVADVATLTGASLIALGQYASAITARDEKLADKLREIGEEAGDYVWPLPLWDEYEPMVKGNSADFANVPLSGNARYAGVIGGGMFLYQFVKDYPKDTKWVHIDMAPRMTSAPDEHLAKGSTGAPVQLLVRLIEKY